MTQSKSHFLADMNLRPNSILRRLIVLRVFISCSFIVYVLGFGLPSKIVFWVGLIILISAIFTLVSWRYKVMETQAKVGFLITQLLWDSAAILLFVWLAGGSTNPFIYYQLLVIAISASILPEKFSWFFSALGICAYTAFMYLDLGHHMAHMDASFRSHLIGMWVNFSGSALLISFFISRLSGVLRSQEKALQLAREEHLKNEQLIGIGTLAASTVHSFGTPLSTITMTASELEALHNDSDTLACTSLIKALIDRCKTTMKKLTSLTTRESLNEQSISIAELTEEIKEYLYLVNARPMPSMHVDTAINSFNLPGGILLLHALINLIDNAVQAATSQVSISIKATPHHEDVIIVIEDDGKGLSRDAVTTGEEGLDSSNGGLGIGLLLVNSTIERLGGTVSYLSATEPPLLTRISVQLPRKM